MSTSTWGTPPPIRLAWVAAGIALAAAPPVHGQIEPGRVYEGGERISEPTLGLTLTLPSGWRGALSPDGSGFVMESSAGDAFMFVVADRMSEEDARAQMSETIDLGTGVLLRPAGEVRQIATGHLSAEFSASGAPTELDASVDVRLTQSGLGVAFILLAPPAAAAEHRSSMREFALSLGVTEAAAPQAGVGGASNDEWLPYMRGRYLARYYTASGYTESTELWLCSDGTFYFNDQAGGFGGGASGAFQGLGSGRWTASGAGASGTLVLNWSNGEQSTWSLGYDYEENKLYLNGDQWLRGQNERCSQ